MKLYQNTHHESWFSAAFFQARTLWFTSDLSLNCVLNESMLSYPSNPFSVYQPIHLPSLTEKKYKSTKWGWILYTIHGWYGLGNMPLKNSVYVLFILSCAFLLSDGLPSSKGLKHVKLSVMNSDHRRLLNVAIPLRSNPYILSRGCPDNSYLL